MRKAGTKAYKACAADNRLVARSSFVQGFQTAFGADAPLTQGLYAQEVRRIMQQDV